MILYGGNNNWFAAYAYWYFKLYGHGDVKLLDGGRKKWELDNRTLTKDPVSRPATQYVAQEQDRSIRSFRDDVVAEFLHHVRHHHPDQRLVFDQENGESVRHINPAISPRS